MEDSQWMINLSLFKRNNNRKVILAQKILLLEIIFFNNVKTKIIIK
jgi:hypothetical protein